MVDVSFLAQSPDWRWSFSRLQQFHACKYGWLLKYVFEVPQQKLFFSEYGKLMHELIACALSDKISWREAQTEYLRRFHDVLRHYGPPGAVQGGYFMDGLRYLRSCGANLAEFQPRTVEQYVEFEVSGQPFCGYIDLVARDADGALCIVDHKSRALKERNPRRAKSNALLDEYLRQLYLYSIPVSQQFGQPEKLIFNCFRSSTLIVEPFSQAAFDETVDWAMQTIDDILRESDWLPCCEPWKCRYLCDVAGECEYYRR
jgi:ATP-dependent exoDNAse (exonuclease V) beta subunit